MHLIHKLFNFRLVETFASKINNIHYISSKMIYNLIREGVKKKFKLFRYNCPLSLPWKINNFLFVIQDILGRGGGVIIGKQMSDHLEHLRALIFFRKIKDLEGWPKRDHNIY